MRIRSRRGTGNIIQFIKLLLSQNDTCGHRVGTLTITATCHRFPSSTSNTEHQHPGLRSMGFGQSCSWAGRRETESGHRKGSRAPGWLSADQGMEKKEIYCCCWGGLVTQCPCSNHKIVLVGKDQQVQP